jgi:hypothetical protein
MTRQQKRKAIRDAEKELSQINNDKVFLGLMAEKEWDGLPDSELEALASGIHTNKVLQRNYTLAMAYMKAIVNLETKIELLKHKKNLSLV